MSKLLLEYENEKAKSFTSIFYDINQIMKNSKSNSSYSIINGICYSYKNLSGDIIHQKLEYNTLSNRNKKIYNDDILNINGYIQDGKSFFKWYGESKKFINKISLYDDYFRIETINSSVYYESDRLNKENLNIDYNNLKSYIKRLKKNNEYKCIYKDLNFEETLNELNLSDLIIPHEFHFDTEERIIKFRVTNRLFQTLKKESKVELKIYLVDKENEVYSIIYNIINKNSDLKNYVVIINY